MKSWYDIYSERMNNNYFEHVRTKYAPFINQVLSTCNLVRHLGNNKMVQLVEIGAGAGNITRDCLRLRHHIDWFACVDGDPKMLELCYKNLKQEGSLKKMGVDILCGDLLEDTWTLYFPAKMPRVIHSHGVLEHFTDAQISRIITNCDNLAMEQVHYIPSDKYEKPSRGDERLLSASYWERYGLVTSFNDGKDLILMRNSAIQNIIGD